MRQPAAVQSAFDEPPSPSPRVSPAGTPLNRTPRGSLATIKQGLSSSADPAQARTTESMSCSQVIEYPPGGRIEYKDKPLKIKCQYCTAKVTTKTTHLIEMDQISAGASICLVGGCLFCFLLPCLLNSYKNVEHMCPRCKCVVGTFRRI